MVLTCRTERMEAFGKTNNQALKVSCQWQETAAVLLPMSRWWSFSHTCGEVYLYILSSKESVCEYQHAVSWNRLKPQTLQPGGSVSCATFWFTSWLGRHGFNEIYNFGFKHLQLERRTEEYTLSLSTLWLASNKASIVSRSVLQGWDSWKKTQRRRSSLLHPNNLYINFLQLNRSNSHRQTNANFTPVWMRFLKAKFFKFLNPKVSPCWKPRNDGVSIQHCRAIP